MKVHTLKKEAGEKAYQTAEERIHHCLETDAQALSLSDLNLKQVPPELTELKKLRHLQIWIPASLPELLESICVLPALQFLDISNSQIETLSVSIGKLQNLEILKADFSRIRTLPDTIGELIMLKELDLSGSLLETLPRSIGKLQNLEILKANFTELERLPDTIGELVMLRELDVSNTQIALMPDSIVNCTSLAVKRRGLRTAHCLNRIAATLSRNSRFFPVFQRRIYSYMCNALDRLQKRLDTCGWRLDSHLCRRENNQCCHNEYVCQYLDEDGCSVESLCCKLWLCNKALEYLDTIAKDRKHPLHRTCIVYLKMRDRFDFICWAFDIPRKGRCSKADAFNPNNTEYMNVYTEKWFNNIRIYPRGLFISDAQAETERNETR
jgi:hypothetical protein